MSVNERHMDGVFITILLATASTLLPALVWTPAEIGQGANAIFMWSAVALATLGGLGAILAWVNRRPLVTAIGLVCMSIAPTYFAYLGNLLCLSLAGYLVIRHRTYSARRQLGHRFGAPAESPATGVGAVDGKPSLEQ